MKRLWKSQGKRIASKVLKLGAGYAPAAYAAYSHPAMKFATKQVYGVAKEAYSRYKKRRASSSGASSSRGGNTIFNPTRGVISGNAPGHSAYAKKGRRRGSKKAYKRKKRWEIKVRAAVQGESKFQQFFQNSILGPSVAADTMSWFEIPVMCGSSYVAPGTGTDANNVYFRVNNDVGDFTPAADIAANSMWTRQALGGQTVAGTVVGATDIRQNLGCFLVYGYVLEYAVQNIQSFPILVEIFELDCIKDFNGTLAAVPMSAAVNIAQGSNSMLAVANANNATREAYVQASGTDINISYQAIGATPHMFADFGAYWHVARSHLHVLDAGQVYRTEKAYKFKPIRFNNFTETMCKKGFSHAIIGSIRSSVIGSASGNYASALSNVAAGQGGFTHTYMVSYNKRFMVKPLDVGNTSFGVRNQIL